MEMIKVKGGVTVFLSEYSSNRSILEPVIEEGPLVAKSDHVFDTFFMLLLERCGGGGLGGGVRYWCTAWTDCRLLFLQWE